MQPQVNQALRRLLAIDEWLRDGSCLSQFDLMDRLQVSRRTIQRDFDCLRRHGAPIRYDAVRRGFCYSDASYRLSFLKVTADELVAVFLAQRLLDQYGATPFAQGIASLFRRCLRLLPAELIVDPEQLRSCLGVKLTPIAQSDATHFGKLAQACLHRRRLRVLYWTAERDDANERMLDPYSMVCAQEDWHLIAYCHRRQSVRTFAVHRIRDLEETGQTFEVPAAFHIDSYLNAAFARVRGEGQPQAVRLRFSPRAARYIRERIWHPTQETEELPNGSLRVTFHLASFLEVKAWAMSWGRECVVEAPEGLREEMRIDATWMVENHRNKEHVSGSGLFANGHHSHANEHRSRKKASRTANYRK